MTSEIIVNSSKVDIKKILMPNGKMYTYYKPEGETWASIIENCVLPDWISYCNGHWVDFNNHESMWSFEKRTKNFLDRCAWIWIQDNPKGLESRYKSISHKVREIPMTECPDSISDYMYSDRQSPMDSNDSRFDVLCDELDDLLDYHKAEKPTKKRRTETKFNRIEKIIKQYPNAERAWCNVDSNNNFVFLGKEYHVPENIAGYERDPDRTDLMDRVYVVSYEGDLMFFDQNVFQIFF